MSVHLLANSSNKTKRKELLMLTSVRTNVKKTFFLDIEIVLSLRDNRTDNVKRIIINPILTMISSSVLKDKKKR